MRDVFNVLLRELKTCLGRQKIWRKAGAVPAGLVMRAAVVVPSYAHEGVLGSPKGGGIVLAPLLP